ncbi:MAG: VOC family protein [Puniceicoccaceae bacterium]|nr:MAG: VOC family protein [Puniceicoccaceae bacterium]
MKITELAFVAYPVTDVDRARRFYRDVLGLKETMAEHFEGNQWWVEYEIGPATLALSNAWPMSGGGAPVAALEVPDLDAALAELKAAGHPPVYGPVETPVCRFFGVADPDNNGITLHQRKT